MPSRMNIISWVIFGLIVGVIVYVVDPKPSEAGLVSTMILGVLGSVLGGFVASLVFGLNMNGFNFSSLLVAVFASVLLLFAGRLYRRS